MDISFTDPIATLLGSWSGHLTLGAILLRISCSALLAALIGCERASKRHSAGLRTFLLVSMASTVAMVLDISLCELAGGKLFLLSAASVIATAVISVNSMLFSSRNQIRGLTTAVGLWASGIIGLAIGAGCYTVTLVAFLGLVCSLTWFPCIEVWLKNRSNHFEFHLELKNSQYLQDLTATLRGLGMHIDDIELNPAYAGSGLSVYSVAVSIDSPQLKKYKTHTEIVEALRTLEYVHHIEEMHQ